MLANIPSGAYPRLLLGCFPCVLLQTALFAVGHGRKLTTLFSIGRPLTDGSNLCHKRISSCGLEMPVTKVLERRKLTGSRTSTTRWSGKFPGALFADYRKDADRTRVRYSS